jgi:hypothetical protein
MMTNDDKLISAQVVIRASSAADAQAVMQEFKRAGFDLGPLFANSFSITAESKRFETYFKATLQSSSGEGIAVKTNEDSVRSDLPLDALPPSVRELIEVIVFSKPPDFGPGGKY